MACDKKTLVSVAQMDGLIEQLSWTLMWFHAHAHDLPLATYLELSFWQTHADQRASEF